MSVNAWFIDESSTDLQIAERLARGGLSTVASHPGGSLDELVARVRRAATNGSCDLLLLDYRLDEEPDADGVRAHFRGGTVAAAIREQVPDVPIVLVTTVAKLEESLEENRQVRSLFDHEVMKSALQDYRHRPRVIQELVDLAEGFSESQAIASRSRTANTWTVLGRILEVPGDELGTLEKAISQPLPKSGSGLARWVLNELLHYSGPLLPEEETSVRLGLTLEAFRRQAVRDWIAEAAYTGAFQVVRPRWWRVRLDQMIRSLKIDGPATSARNRARAVASVAGTSSLPAARCTWCHEDEVTRACWLCREPVDAQHCLAMGAEYRPQWADVNVVCFRCVQTGRADEITFLPGSGATIELIVAGRLAGADD